MGKEAEKEWIYVYVKKKFFFLKKVKKKTKTIKNKEYTQDKSLNNYET